MHVLFLPEAREEEEGGDEGHETNGVEAFGAVSPERHGAGRADDGQRGVGEGHDPDRQPVPFEDSDSEVLAFYVVRPASMGHVIIFHVWDVPLRALQPADAARHEHRVLRAEPGQARNGVVLGRGPGLIVRIKRSGEQRLAAPFF